MFRFKHLRLDNYRCFQDLSLTLDPTLTVFFAENGDGKSSILNALALGLAVFQPRNPAGLKLSATEDPRMETPPQRDELEPGGPCRLTWTADIGERESVVWSSGVDPRSGRTSKAHQDVYSAIEAMRTPGSRWPLFAWYGTERMSRGRTRNLPSVPRDRWEGYQSSLDPSLNDAPLLEWLLEEMLTDTARRQEGEEERFLVSAVLDTVVRATPGIQRAWYDARRRSPVVRRDNGTVIPWKQLSDGYHVFLSLVADIARRAVMLNSMDGGEAPQKVEGVVLIDEIDLHLHPRWQRTVLEGLRSAFPRLQFIVSTHSPQVLSSAENRQVRRIVQGQIQQDGVFVEGRDTNAILRDVMDTDDRDEGGRRALDALYEAIEFGSREEAVALFETLVAKWSELDPAVIRARRFIEREE